MDDDQASLDIDAELAQMDDQQIQFVARMALALSKPVVPPGAKVTGSWPQRLPKGFHKRDSQSRAARAHDWMLHKIHKAEDIRFEEAVETRLGIRPKCGKPACKGDKLWQSPFCFIHSNR